MTSDDREKWHGGVPPGVPGAGWLIGLFFLFAVFTFTGWYEGWWENDYNNAAAPAHHTTTGAANKGR